MTLIHGIIQQKKGRYDAQVKKVADTLSFPNPTFETSLTKLIWKSVEEDDCNFYCIYGPLRVGKSSYALKSIAPIYQTWMPEILKQFIIFRPEEFIAVMKRLMEKKVKYPSIVWDDAGIWLNSMKWNQPLVRKIGEFFQAIGTVFSSVIFTSPLPTHITNAVRNFPALSNVRIYKVNQNPQKPRQAKGYYQTILPDMKKHHIIPFLDDYFSAILPTEFYRWYHPYRQSYADETFAAIEKQMYADAEEILAQNPDPKPSKESKRVRKSVEPIPAITEEIEEPSIEEVGEKQDAM